MASTAGDPASRVVVVVKDLFFVARIREVARLAGVPVEFARTPAEIERALAAGRAPLLLIDLTTAAWDYDALFAAVERAALRPTVLGYTTHALASQTRAYHPRCDRVVTKEALTQELGDILRGALR